MFVYYMILRDPNHLQYVYTFGLCACPFQCFHLIIPGLLADK